MKHCFVVQGFGEKTDLTNGRRLNLDASYQVIKGAVEDAGLVCMRADEVVSSGTIDIPMYDWIMKADLLIADLSTYNVNAAYELGVRYGVSPRATIIVAETEFKDPFDVSHMVLHRYRHLGEDVGTAEAARFRRDLAGVIRVVMASQRPDSPLNEFFELDPPARRAQAARLEPAMSDDAKTLLDQARKALAAGRFGAARELLEQSRELRPNDVSTIQELVLATYKAAQPDAATALETARTLIVEHLNPHTTNDPETLGLWGAIHKRRWELTKIRAELDISIAAYERGFYLKQDYYNGINLAFLLNIRAIEHRREANADEAIADFVLARRVRRDVRGHCERALAIAPQASDERYWVVATLWEVSVGLADASSAATWQKEAEAMVEASWMLDTTRSQVTRLEQLLATSPLQVLPPS